MKKSLLSKTILKKLSLTAIALSAMALSFPATGKAQTPDIASWDTSVTSVGSNVVTDTTTYTFAGTSGTAYNYGTLSGTSTGVTIEYVFDETGGAASSIAVGGFGSADSSDSATTNVWSAKVDQYASTGLFGLSLSGIVDASPTNTAANDSIFNSLVDLTIVENTNGTVAEYVNGQLLANGVGSYTYNAAGFSGQQIVGGSGFLGSSNTATSDLFTGTVYGVATYNTALTASDVLNNYDALIAVPEPSTIALTVIFGAGMLLLFRRRRTA